VRTLVGRLAPLAIVGLATVIAVFRFLAIDATPHSVSDTLRPWLIQVTVIAAVAGVALVVLRRWPATGRGNRR